MANNKILGNSGEELVCSYLENAGMTVLHRNFRCKAGEIDIIARDEAAIAFIEVKTRTSDKFGAPCEAVGKSKQGRIVKAALFYLQSRQLFDYMSRFDIVEVVVNGSMDDYAINHIKDAFQYSGRYGY